MTADLESSVSNLLKYISEGYNCGAGKVRIKSKQYEDVENFEDYDENRGKRGRKKLIKNEIPSDLPEQCIEKIENYYTCLLCPEPDHQETNISTIHQYNHDPSSIETVQQTLEHENCIFDIESIVTHMKNEHGLLLYVCNFCGEDFRKRTLFSIHLDEHVAIIKKQKNEEGWFQCLVCNRNFSNFLIHNQKHYYRHPRSILWTCKICDKLYKSLNRVDDHINTHTGIRPYKCETCGKDFASINVFRTHCNKHKDIHRQYSCRDCGKTFLSARDLTQHERIHSVLRYFICVQCGKVFKTAKNLKDHSITHSGYKPFNCRKCGKAFARNGEIPVHERTHNGEKHYLCELCGSNFSQSGNLQTQQQLCIIKIKSKYPMKISIKDSRGVDC